MDFVLFIAKDPVDSSRRYSICNCSKYILELWVRLSCHLLGVCCLLCGSVSNSYPLFAEWLPVEKTKWLLHSCCCFQKSETVIDPLLYITKASVRLRRTRVKQPLSNVLTTTCISPRVLLKSLYCR